MQGGRWRKGKIYMWKSLWMRERGGGGGERRGLRCKDPYCDGRREEGGGRWVEGGERGGRRVEGGERGGRRVEGGERSEV